MHLRAPFGESWFAVTLPPVIGDPCALCSARASLPTVQDAEFRLDEVFAGLNLQQVKVVATRNFGAPIRRNEDGRLLSGQALFVDDVELPGMVHAAFLRSNVAHARIRSIDVSAARARESRFIPPRTSAITGRRVRCLSRRRPLPTPFSISAQSV